MDFAPLVLLSPSLILLFSFVIGASVGSFLTLVTYRLPREEPIGTTRSRCPHCATTLRARDLLPIFSWLVARGRCRHCGTRISSRYPLTELACALGTMAAIGHYGMGWEALAIAGLWWCVVAIFLTDLEHYLILDEVQIALGLFGILHSLLLGIPTVDFAFAALTGLLIGLSLKYGFLYFRGKDGLGMGDVKFLAVAGLWLGDAASFVPFLFFAGLLGVASGLGWRLAGKGERFPFGPALAAALLMAVIFPETIQGFWKLYGFLH